MRMLKGILFYMCCLRVAHGRIGKFLQYDAECPFLADEEYAKRMLKGRCPPISATPLSHFTTSDASAPKNLSFFERGTKRLLLKFVSMSKRRTAYVELSANGPLVENVIEGVFLQIQCPVREADENKTIKWYFDGQEIVENLLNWRIHVNNRKGGLLVTPVLAAVDAGNFECFADGEWFGGVWLRIETTTEALLAGYRNFLLGSLFSLLFTVASIVYHLRFKNDSMEKKTKSGVKKQIQN